MPSTIAAKKCLAWLQFCRSIGWRKEDTPLLADLWWKYHDPESGELI